MFQLGLKKMINEEMINITLSSPIVSTFYYRP